MPQISPVVEVYARADGESTWSCGSGYEVGGGLILTASHVVTTKTGKPRTVLARLVGAPDLLDCILAWHGPDSVDVALLRIANADQAPTARHNLVRWGRFVTSIPNQHCSAQGFPAAQESPDKIRDVEQLSGSINPGTGVKADLLAISVDDPPTRLAASESPWAGMSGAAVFCNDLLVGVITRDPTGFDSRRLTAVPVSACIGDAAFRMIVEFATGQTLSLQPVEIDGLFAFQRRAMSPTQLLRPDVETVEFRARVDELEQLHNWCSAPISFSARLIVGPGGQGKTRLATRFAKELMGEGWVAGLVQENPDEAALTRLAGLNVPAMLVLDYSEARPTLLARLAEAVAALGAPVRLLLLARTAGDWRDSTAADHEVLAWLPDTPVRNLTSLEPTAPGRIDAWRQAVTALARSLQRLQDFESYDWAASAMAVLRTTPDWLSAGSGDVPVLGIHMDALAALLTAAEPKLTGTSPLDTLLLHERRYWRRAATARDLVLDDTTAVDAVAAATLWSAETEAEALVIASTIRGLRDLPEDRRSAAVHWLAGLYPEKGRFWGALQPDRLGEHQVAKALAMRPDLLIATMGAASRGQAEHALTIMTRATPDHPALKDSIRVAVLTMPATFGPAAVTVALQVGDPASLLEALADLVEIPAIDDEATARLLRSIYEEVPSATHILLALAATIAAHLTTAYRQLAATDSGSYLPELAWSLNELSARLGRIGQHEEALTAGREAVATYRRLAETDPETYVPRLARALNNLSTRLSFRGLNADGLAVANEAVDIYRGLVKSMLEVHRPELASSLNNLSNQFSHLGRLKEGRKAAKEAVAIYRSLVETNPDAYRPRLAMSLNNLSNLFGRVGDKEGGLASAEEAVAIYRSLAETNHDAYQPELARSLNTLSNRLSHLSRDKDGLVVAEEAVALYRRLVEAFPDPYLPLLARSLNNLSRRLSNLGLEQDDLGSRKRALAAGQESTNIYRQLAQADPYVYLPSLARWCENLSRLLWDLEQRDEAVDASTEAVAIYRRLAQSDRQSNLPGIARALDTLSAQLASRGSDKASVSAIEEAVAAHRSLAETDRHQLIDLAKSLRSMSSRLWAINKRNEALLASEEAVAIWRSLARAHAETYLPELATSLLLLADQLGGVGRGKESVAVIEEAVVIRQRQVRGKRNIPHRRLLLESLSALANQLDVLGRQTDAIAAQRRAVMLERHLARSSAEAFLPSLAASLDALASNLAKAGRHEQARKVSKEAAAVWLRLVPTNPDTRLADLAEAMSALAAMLAAPTGTTDVEAARQEAHSLRRYLAQPGEATELLLLGQDLSSLGYHLDALGRTRDSTAAIEKADAIRGRLAEFRSPQLPLLGRFLNLLAGQIAVLGNQTPNNDTTASQPLREARLPNLHLVATYFNTIAGQFGALGNQTPNNDTAAGSQPLPEARFSSPHVVGRYLNTLASQFAALGSQVLAQAASEEALRVYRNLGGKGSGSYLGEEFVAWQQRPLDTSYPVLMIDTIYVEIREYQQARNGHNTVKAPIYIVVGVNSRGDRSILGLWQGVGKANQWRTVFGELRRRGVKDVRIVSSDPLQGLREALGKVWPGATVQMSIVHLMRISLRNVSREHRDNIRNSLRTIFVAPTEAMAAQRLAGFEQAWGKLYPNISQRWRSAWDKFTPLLAFSPGIRGQMYTTKAFEILSVRMRKAARPPAPFRDYQTAVEALYRVVRGKVEYF